MQAAAGFSLQEADGGGSSQLSNWGDFSSMGSLCTSKGPLGDTAGRRKGKKTEK